MLDSPQDELGPQSRVLAPPESPRFNSPHIVASSSRTSPAAAVGTVTQLRSYSQTIFGGKFRANSPQAQEDGEMYSVRKGCGHTTRVAGCDSLVIESLSTRSPCPTTCEKLVSTLMGSYMIQNRRDMSQLQR